MVTFSADRTTADIIRMLNEADLLVRLYQEGAITADICTEKLADHGFWNIKFDGQIVEAEWPGSIFVWRADGKVSAKR